MTWASKRRLTYFVIVFVVITIPLVFSIYKHYDIAPTCTDGKQNGSETGIDCGGICALYCTGEAKEINIKWARAFPVTDTVYNALAYIENPNIKAGIAKINYEFKFFDDKNVFITSRKGSTYIAPNNVSAIFEPNISIPATRKLTRTVFNFTSPEIFYRVSDLYNAFDIVTQAGLPTETDGVPKLTATIKNKTLKQFSGLDIIAVLYDKDGNVVNVSKTYFDILIPQSQKQVFFSWLKPFTIDTVKTEIITRYNPFFLN